MNTLRPFTHPLLGPRLEGLTRYGELQPPSPVIGDVVAGASTIDTDGASISSKSDLQPILDADAGPRSAPVRALFAALLALPFSGMLAFVVGGVTHSPALGAIVAIVVGGAVFALGWMLFAGRPNRSGTNVLVGSRGVQLASLQDDQQLTTVTDSYDSDNPWFSLAWGSQTYGENVWLSIRAGGTQVGVNGRTGLTKTPHVVEAVRLALDNRCAAQEAAIQRTLAEGRAYVRPIENGQAGPGEIRLESGTLTIRYSGHVLRSGRLTITYPSVDVTVPRAGVVVTVQDRVMSFRTARGVIELPSEYVGDAAVFARVFRRGAA